MKKIIYIFVFLLPLLIFACSSSPDVMDTTIDKQKEMDAQYHQAQEELKIEAEAKAKVEAEAKAKAETEAKAKVEAEVKQTLEMPSIKKIKPFPTNVPFALDFSPSEQYEQFSIDTQQNFQNAVKINFDKAFQKAGVNAAVFDGTRLWTGAEGKASATDKMTPTTPMIIRSTSKIILGALMISQIDRGLYNLDDTVETLLSSHPDYNLINIPNVNTQVTVKQLLNMTSGISDWSKPEDRNGRITIMMDQHWKPANNLKQISSKFTTPGFYNYSYANSILLGLIASHVEKKRFERYLSETIL